MRTPFAWAAAAVAVGLAAVAPAAQAAPAAAPAAQAGCPGNLLQNPGFEGPSHKTESEGTSLSSAVGNSWSPWFVRGNATWNREPEFKVEQTAIGGDPARVHSGANSMKWFTTWGTHTAGVYQRVAARPGTAYTFSIFAQAYSGEADAFDEARHTFASDHDKPGNYVIMVGIDPTGAVPPMGSPPPSTVVWSAPVRTVDAWVNLAVSTVAKGGAVTVYTHSSVEFPVKHNDSFWDDACLRVGSFAPAGGVISGAPAAPAAPVAPSDAPVASPSTSTGASVAPQQPSMGSLEGNGAGAAVEMSMAVTKGRTYMVKINGSIDAPASWNGAGFRVWGPYGKLGQAALSHGDGIVEFTPSFDGTVDVKVFNYLPGQVLSYRVVTMGEKAGS
ncbi:MAG: hypothetical protein ABI780_09320 [Ardenticatenales bacterium]